MILLGDDVSEVDEKFLFSRRCGLEQGTRPDGSRKVRTMDDGTESGANACAVAAGKIRPDRLDTLVAITRRISRMCGGRVSLWKADIDAAYRRVPVAPGDRWMAGVAYRVGGKLHRALHLAQPFGFVGSVYNWDRVGAMVGHIAMSLLRLPALRYVDDYFGSEAEECIECARKCFTRLVKALLGTDALAEGKVKSGNPLVILGIQVDVQPDGLVCSLPEEKRAKWLASIEDALAEGCLPARQAQKLGGRLGFAAQAAFRRLGRAMLRPIYRQQYTPLRRGAMSEELRGALVWWRYVLRDFVVAEKVPVAIASKQVH